MIGLRETVAAAARALAANRMRSMLMTLGIVIGIASTLMMIAVGEGARKRTLDQIASFGTDLLIVTPRFDRGGRASASLGVKYVLREEDAEAIRREVRGVKSVAAVVFGRAAATYRDRHHQAPVLGTTADYLAIRSFALSSGRLFTSAEVRNGAKIAVIGQTVAHELCGDRCLDQAIRLGPIPVNVIGILEPKGQNAVGEDQDDVILVPLQTATRRLPEFERAAASAVDSIYIRVESDADQSIVQADIAALLRQSHRLSLEAEDNFRLRNLAEILRARDNVSRVYLILLAAIASTSLVVGGIGIMNIMLVSVTERTREIGLRMAVGARPADIMLQFLIEAVALATIGGVAGVAAGVAAIRGLASIAPFAMVVDPLSVPIAVGFAGAIGIFFGFYPARQAARLDPVAALRYE